MRSSILIAIIMQIVLITLASPANAACNHKTVYASVVNRYIFQDTAFVGYDDPVFQGGATLSCDSGWWFDLFNSSGLSTRGQYGRLAERDYADEFDYTVAKDAEFSSPLGVFQYQIFASYYMLSDFNHGSDDLIELRGQLGRAFKLPDKLEKITVSPYVRLIEYVGLGAYRDQMIIRPGLKTAIQLTEKLVFQSNVAIGFDPSAGTEVFRSDTGFDYHLSKSITLFTEAQTAEHTKSAIMAGFSRTF